MFLSSHVFEVISYILTIVVEKIELTNILEERALLGEYYSIVESKNKIEPQIILPLLTNESFIMLTENFNKNLLNKLRCGNKIYKINKTISNF